MKNIHKGWIILTLITISVLASLGFGRFSFGAILPFMKNGLHLNYQETGYLASSIFFGYLITALASGHFVIRFKAKRVILTSLFLILVGMIIAATSTNFYMAYVGCFIIGIGSGGAYVPALGLLGYWFSARYRGMALGIAMAGAGVGIVFSGLTVPFLLDLAGMDGWRISWYVLALLVFIIAFLNLLFLKNRPEDVNLQPISKDESPNQRRGNGKHVEDTTVYRNKTLWFIGIIYFCWGMSYLVFSTFLVDYLIVDVGFKNETAGSFFAVAGITSIISGFIWGNLSDQIGRIPTLMIVFFVQCILLLSLSFSGNSVLIFLIVAVYGLTLWAVPTIINASVGDYTHPKYMTVAMGFVTFFFSTGQLLSPVLTGFLIEYSQSYFLALLFSSFTACLGGLGCVKLLVNDKKKEEQTEFEMQVIKLNE